MNEFLKMDVFFLVTTIVVILIGILIAFILYRIWRILGHVERISEAVEEESNLVRADIAEFRSNVRTEGFKLKSLTGFFIDSLKQFVGRRKKSSKDS